MNSEINPDWFIEVQAGNGRPLRVVDVSYIVSEEFVDNTSNFIYAVVPGNPERGDAFVMRHYDPRKVISANTAKYIENIARFGHAYAGATPKFKEILENLRIRLNHKDYDSLDSWLKDPTADPTF